MCMVVTVRPKDLSGGSPLSQMMLCWLGLQVSLPDMRESACLRILHLLSGGKLLNGVQTCHLIA